MALMSRLVNFGCESFLRRALADSAHPATSVRPPPRQERTSAMQRAAGSCKVLVIAEVHDGLLQLSTAHTVTCGKRICGDVEVALFANDGERLAQAARRLEGVTAVVLSGSATDPDELACRAAELVRARGSTHVFAPSSDFGEGLIARLARHLRVAPVLSVMGVVTPTTFTRARSRTTIATIETTARPVLATVRLGAFHATRLPRLRPARRSPP